MTWLPGALAWLADIALFVMLWRSHRARRNVVVAGLRLLAIARPTLTALLFPFAALALRLMPSRWALRLSRNSRRSFPGVSRRNRRAFRKATLKLEADKARAAGSGDGGVHAV